MAMFVIGAEEKAKEQLPPVRLSPRVKEKGVLKPGQMAPDFTLPRLALVKEGEKTVGKVSKETVKLSSFRGKKPVLLILSSYT